MGWGEKKDSHLGSCLRLDKYWIFLSFEFSDNVYRVIQGVNFTMVPVVRCVVPCGIQKTPSADPAATRSADPLRSIGSMEYPSGP